MKNVFRQLFIVLLALLAVTSVSLSQEDEAYTRTLDRLTSVKHFHDRRVLFIIGFDTSKSMSVEFDRSKKLTQTILSRYSAPGDSIYIFGFADQPSVLPATETPRTISNSAPDKEIASINENLLSLPRSSAQGTLFGRAKLFALAKSQEFGAERNVVVLLFSDNNSEIEMGNDERERLKTLEGQVASESETIPLHSQGVSRLWLTLYTNGFPDTQPLAGPDGNTKLDNPRLAWAAHRAGSQTLEFISPASDRVEGSELEVVVQFLGSSQPESALLSVGGKERQKATFSDGRATWDLTDLKPGTHLLIAQAVLPDGKVRNAEKQITVTPGKPVSASPSPPPPPPKTSPTPRSTPDEKPRESGGFPLGILILPLLLGGVVYFLSQKSVKVRVIGPDSEESFLLAKGQWVRVGGQPRVESEHVFRSNELNETIASVRCLPFGKAKVFVNSSLRQGSVEVETDEGYTVGESGESLLTTATVTYTDDRGRKQVFTLVKEDASGPGAEEAGHFSSGVREETSGDDVDWRS